MFEHYLLDSLQLADPIDDLALHSHLNFFSSLDAISARLLDLLEVLLPLLNLESDLIKEVTQVLVLLPLHVLHITHLMDLWALFSAVLHLIVVLLRRRRLHAKFGRKPRFFVDLVITCAGFHTSLR